MVSQYKVLSDTGCPLPLAPLTLPSSCCLPPARLGGVGHRGARVLGAVWGKMWHFKDTPGFVFQKKKGLLAGMALAAKLLGRREAPEGPGTSQLQLWFPRGSNAPLSSLHTSPLCQKYCSKSPGAGRVTLQK